MFRSKSYDFWLDYKFLSHRTVALCDVCFSNPSQDYRVLGALWPDHFRSSSGAGIWPLAKVSTGRDGDTNIEGEREKKGTISEAVEKELDSWELPAVLSFDLVVLRRGKKSEKGRKKDQEITSPSWNEKSKISTTSGASNPFKLLFFFFALWEKRECLGILCSLQQWTAHIRYVHVHLIPGRMGNDSSEQIHVVCIIKCFFKLNTYIHQSVSEWIFLFHSVNQSMWNLHDLKTRRVRSMYFLSFSCICSRKRAFRNQWRKACSNSWMDE